MQSIDEFFSAAVVHGGKQELAGEPLRHVVDSQIGDIERAQRGRRSPVPELLDAIDLDVRVESRQVSILQFNLLVRGLPGYKEIAVKTVILRFGVPLEQKGTAREPALPSMRGPQFRHSVLRFGQ